MKKLRIYFIELTIHPRNHYDYYDSCVVIAHSPAKAKLLAIAKCKFNLNNIDCELLGNANAKQKEGIVCSSFNAG